ncbi:MAG TPA: hypothetical protein VJ574_03135 [Candidatus Bathyarchaeia archaeon]|nr:hypothetical protein [Candidatus Bathyarchaeia archaeon]
MKSWQIIVINAPLLVLCLIAVTLGFTLNVPDLLRVDYGWPLAWGMHTMSTIAGPVDIWKVNVIALAIDLLIWFAVVAAANWVWLIKSKKSNIETMQGNKA